MTNKCYWLFFRKIHTFNHALFGMLKKKKKKRIKYVKMLILLPTKIILTLTFVASSVVSIGSLVALVCNLIFAVYTCIFRTIRLITLSILAIWYILTNWNKTCNNCSLSSKNIGAICTVSFLLLISFQRSLNLFVKGGVLCYKDSHLLCFWHR